MKALLTQPPGGWAHTAIAELPEPMAGDNDVILDIHAAGINPADYFQIEGSYPGGPKPPFVCGRDAAGVVRVGDKMERFPAGTKVVVLQSSDTDLAAGVFCQRQRVSAHCLAAMPEHWTFVEAAAAPLAYQTAWKALVSCGRLEAGQTAVITGASGGVGSAAVQLAHGLGATVVALSRSPDKRQRLLEIGADFAIDSGAADVKNQVFAAVKKKGVDVVVDTVGGPSLSLAVHLLGREGRVSVLGLLGGVEGSIPIPSLMFKKASIHGVLVTDGTPAENRAIWGRIVETLNGIGAKPLIDSVFNLEDYPAAIARLKASPFGKVVLSME